MKKFEMTWRRFQEKVGGWDLPILVLWAVTLFCIGPFVLLQVFSPNNRYGAIPVPIHSESEADYSRDPQNQRVPVISLDILRDLMIGGEDMEEISWLQTLTATYRPLISTSTPQPTSLPRFTSTPSPSSPPDQPEEGTPTYFPSATSTVGPTATPRRPDASPTDSPGPTIVPPHPSATTQAPPPTTVSPQPPTPVTPDPSETTAAPPEPTSSTPIIHPTKVTPAPPTDIPDTPEPTSTPAPRPTQTPVPPTPQPTEPPRPTIIFTPVRTFTPFP